MTNASTRAAQMPAAPALDSEIFDDDAGIGQSGRLAELLRLWNELVRSELGTVQSFVVYDEQAKKQQQWHQFLVGVAAVTGSMAVLLAILQLASYAGLRFAGSPFVNVLAGTEYLAAILALIAVVFGLGVAFHTRWQLQRMKAEQYRFVKFHFLLHAGGWLNKSEHERREHLQTMLAGLHALDSHDAHDWAQGVSSLVDDDSPMIAQADGPLVDDLVRYFSAKRIGSQRGYFSKQAKRRNENERATWFIPPTCFFLSIVCAFLHFAVEIAGHSPDENDGETDAAKQAVQQATESIAKDAKGAGEDLEESAESEHPPSPLMIACLLGAAAFPVLGAMVRTMRTAFEFGRNANRFEGVARILADVGRQLEEATLPAVKLELLREAETVLRNENRSWMRLMIEAEWFG